MKIYLELEDAQSAATDLMSNTSAMTEASNWVALQDLAPTPSRASRYAKASASGDQRITSSTAAPHSLASVTITKHGSLVSFKKKKTGSSNGDGSGDSNGGANNSDGGVNKSNSGDVDSDDDDDSGDVDGISTLLYVVGWVAAMAMSFWLWVCIQKRLCTKGAPKIVTIDAPLRRGGRDTPVPIPTSSPFLIPQVSCGGIRPR